MSTNAFKPIPPFYAPDSPCANETSLIARTALPVQPSTYLISQQEIGFTTPPTSMTNLSSAQQSFKQPFSTGLIPKPDGEVGRPRRGGYNLEKQLGWNKRDYMELKV
ncbi:hypothetical protein JR316_0009336 [Psilocybe cubensis]|uniref:Uncharacterized protein n=1 Tax=Psilocybe cubensis TaxID=181762 RepID=A0ACB8GTT3_PSICU|nr:hypothetical protein JR316_0009336 [Psilocybe cubensis]KAH9478874.1 hypothetical protein JR316_0009336 [Psilocybe cubensis]